MFNLALVAGVPAEVLHRAVASFNLSIGVYDKAIEHLLEVNDYEKALGIFLRSEVPKMVQNRSHRVSNLFLVKLASGRHSKFRFDSNRRIVELLDMYLRFLDYVEEEEVEVLELRKFPEEIFAKVSSFHTFGAEELPLLKFIVNEVLDKTLTLALETGSGETSRVINPELISMLASNKNLLSLFRLDWSLSEEIISSFRHFDRDQLMTYTLQNYRED